MQKFATLVSVLSLPVLVAVVGGFNNFDMLIDAHINNGIYKVLVFIFSILSMVGLFCGISRLHDSIAVFFNTCNGTVVGALISMNMAKCFDGSMTPSFAILLSLGVFILWELVDNVKGIKSCFYEPESKNAKKNDRIFNSVAIILTIIAIGAFIFFYRMKIMPTIAVL
ncbi:TPA: hypothetical protein NJ508_004432 [Vibrio parahaemolyticus]|nr:hypothetical protein [Vibrio parahaemolyticus]MDG2903542.1 hypothetical protein [Vibrio parahaemolyticus]HCG8132966.1 hypothetical protein [Vibrio parahaemolyticus]